MKTKFRPHGGELGNTLAARGWRFAAACRNADVELFFTFERIAEAQTFCERCPVREECRLAGRREVGTWGGIYRTAKAQRTAAGQAVAS